MEERTVRVKVLLPDGDRLEEEVSELSQRTLHDVKDRIVANRRDWPHPLFTGFKLGGSTRWLTLDSLVAEFPGMTLLLWTTPNPRPNDTIVPRDEPHGEYWSLPVDCWSGEGYVATGLELKAFPFVDEGSLIRDCANCLNKIIRRTQNRRGHEIRFEAAHQIRRKEWKAHLARIRRALDVYLEEQEQRKARARAARAEEQQQQQQQHRRHDMGGREGRKRPREEEEQPAAVEEPNFVLGSMFPDGGWRIIPSVFKDVHMMHPVPVESFRRLPLEDVDTVLYLDLDNGVWLSTHTPLPPNVLVLGVYQGCWPESHCQPTTALTDHVQRQRLFFVHAPGCAEGTDTVLSSILCLLAYERVLPQADRTWHVIASKDRGYVHPIQQFVSDGFRVAYLEDCDTVVGMLREAQALHGGGAAQAVTGGEESTSERVKSESPTSPSPATAGVQAQLSRGEGKREAEASGDDDSRGGRWDHWV